MYRLMLDGCDGVGKSTLAEYIAHNNNADVLHMTAHSISTVESYKDRLNISIPIIFDRCFLSEVVYSRIFNRPTEFDDDHTREILSLAKEKGYKIVILDCSLDEILRRVAIRNNESEDLIRKFSELKNKYLEVAKLFDIPVVSVDNKTTEEIANEIYNI